MEHGGMERVVENMIQRLHLTLCSRENMPGKKPQEIIKEAGGLEKYYDKYDEVFDKDRGQAFYFLETTV